MLGRLHRRHPHDLHLGLLLPHPLWLGLLPRHLLQLQLRRGVAGGRGGPRLLPPGCLARQAGALPAGPGGPQEEAQLRQRGGERGLGALAQVLDSRAPARGWRVSRQLQMPAGVAEHCAVTVAGGPGGRELLVTGGRGRGARVMKLNLRTKTWYSLHRLEEGRRRHACTKVTLNGRPGVVVSGGASSSSTNSTSVEFYDSSSGQWFTLPPLQVWVVVVGPGADLHPEGPAEPRHDRAGRQDGRHRRPPGHLAPHHTQKLALLFFAIRPRVSF